MADEVNADEIAARLLAGETEQDAAEIVRDAMPELSKAEAKAYIEFLRNGGRRR